MKTTKAIALIALVALFAIKCAQSPQIVDDPEVVVDSALIKSRNKSPIADAGVDQTITLPTNTVSLDGSKSTDPDGTIKSYLWTLSSGPSGYSIFAPTSSQTAVNNLTKGVYVFNLKVTDNLNKSANDNVSVTVNENIVPPPPPPTGETYFEGDMQNVTVTKSGSGYKLNGWSDLYAQVNNIYLNNLATSDSYAYQQMVPDPAGSGRTVMMGRILDSDPSQPATSRAQMTVSYKSTTNLPVYHTSHRMYIHPDLKYIEQYPGVADWFSLVEIWTKRDPNMDGDSAGSARWGLSLHKSSAVGSPLFWHLYGEYMQPSSKRFQDFWAYDNKTFAVPFGQWITLDIYLKRGTDSAGQFKITVTPDGGTTTTVFDVNGTTEYPNRSDLYLDSWQPFKLYIGDTWMDWMRGNGKYMAIYYNDYKWYKN